MSILPIIALPGIITSLLGPPANVGDMLASFRPGIRTLEVEWAVHHHGVPDEGLVERFTTRASGKSIMEENRGNEHGFHETIFGALPDSVSKLSPEELQKHAYPPEARAGTRRVLLQEDDEILATPAMERPVFGMIGTKGPQDGRRPTDFQVLGFAPAFWSYSKNDFGIPDMWLDGFESAKPRQGFVGGMRTIDADYGTNSFRWYFDPHQGDNPVKAEFYLNGELYYVSETEYEQINGAWFPKSATYYKDDFLRPYKIIEVKQATFDEPWHQQEFGREDMGWLDGTFIKSRNGAEYWTGAGLVTAEEFWERVTVYDVLPDPRIVELLADSAGISPDDWIARERANGEIRREAYKREHGEEPWLINVRTEEDDPWDVYVEEFIKKHELPEAAVKRAEDQLERAKNVRDAQRRKNHKAMKEAEKRKDKEKLEKFKEREERIFKEMLVRPLDKLAKQAKEKEQETAKRD